MATQFTDISTLFTESRIFVVPLQENSEYSPGSIQVWKTFGRYLYEYCDPGITFDDIDKPFADGFTQFLLKKGFMSNTINKNVTCFRKLCNLAAMEGYNKNAVSLKVWKDRAVKETDD